MFFNSDHEEGGLFGLPAISSVTDSPNPFNPSVALNATINFTLSADADVTLTLLKGTAPVKVIADTDPAGLTTTSGTTVLCSVPGATAQFRMVPPDHI